jgi:hypothetical protein
MNVKIWSVLFIGLIFMGCVTFPIPSSNEDTLVVIYVENDQHGNTTDFAGASYVLVISKIENDEEAAEIELGLRNKYVYLKGLEPGGYYISSFYLKQPDGSKSKKYRIKKEYCQFTVVRGELTIVPKAFGTKFVESGDSANVVLQPYKYEEEVVKEKLLAVLEEDHPEEIAAWTIAP